MTAMINSVLMPLETLFDYSFLGGYKLTQNAFFGIVIMSMVISMLVAPIYESHRHQFWILLLEIPLLCYSYYYFSVHSDLMQNLRVWTLGSVFSKHIGLNCFVIFCVSHACFLAIICLLYFVMKKRGTSDAKEKKTETTVSRLVYILCMAFLTIVEGAMIPTYVIRSSPSEFVMSIGYESTGHLLLGCFFRAFGLYVVLFGMFYFAVSTHVRYVLSCLASIASAIVIIDYSFFGRDYGNMSVFLSYDVAPITSRGEIIANAIILVLCICLILVLWKKPNYIRVLCVVGVVEVVLMSSLNLVAIHVKEKETLNAMGNASFIMPELHIDKSGRNVIIIMLDRAINGFIPFLISENPDLEDYYDGFTYYPNSLSYGAYTNVGTMSLYGGYEYIPDEVNRRDNVALRDKQNEALRIMPVLFSEAGYSVVVCDPPYANYQSLVDMDFFGEDSGISAFNLERAFDQDRVGGNNRTRIAHNLFRYSLFRGGPVFLHHFLYDKGRYNDPKSFLPDINTNYVVESLTQSYGYSDGFMDGYNVLRGLDGITFFSNEGRNNLIILNNSTTHGPQMLQEPEYEPRLEVDNTTYESAHAIRYDATGRELVLSTVDQLTHYQINMAALVQVGKWMDYLRENDAYDNTRIIIVSDHGRGLGLAPYIVDNASSLSEINWKEDGADYMDMEYKDPMWYNPLLMVKDFDSHGFNVDDSFMTNADTPMIAFEGIIENPINPFTHNPITSVAKQDQEQHIIYTQWNIEVNNGNTYMKGVDLILRNHNVLDLDNWTVSD